MLVIPIERSLIYVEPLYLEAEQNSLPILARVILVYGNRIAMAETLPDALDAILMQEGETAAPVIRDLEADSQGIDTIVPGIIGEPTGTEADTNEGEVNAQ